MDAVADAGIRQAPVGAFVAQTDVTSGSGTGPVSALTVTGPRYTPFVVLTENVAEPTGLGSASVNPPATAGLVGGVDKVMSSTTGDCAATLIGNHDTSATTIS
ncbi:MAG: hypothetical protein IPO19_03040 [Rhodoferax sp.]|nr:hypothetical protein [Rhodoferax sp.]